MTSQRLRPRPASFQPRFTLSLLYFAGFFFLYCLALVAPALYEVAQSLPPGPEQQKAAEEVAKETVQPRLWIAVVLAALSVGLGVALGILPGLKRR